MGISIGPEFYAYTLGMGLVCGLIGAWLARSGRRIALLLVILVLLGLNLYLIRLSRATESPDWVVYALFWVRIVMPATFGVVLGAVAMLLVRKVTRRA